MAATQANASKPEIHTAPFIGSPPALSELDAANLPAGTVLAIAVPAAATQRRDPGRVTARFENKVVMPKGQGTTPGRPVIAMPGAQGSASTPDHHPAPPLAWDHPLFS